MKIFVSVSLLLVILTQGGAANENQTFCRNVHYNVQNLHQVNYYINIKPSNLLNLLWNLNLFDLKV